MIPHCRLQIRSQGCCPRFATPHWPSLTILYTWQNLVRLISVSTIVLIKGQNGPYVASTIFSTYHFNIYPILIQIPCTLYYNPYITSIFFLIFIWKKYIPPYILTHITSKTNAQCPPRASYLPRIQYTTCALQWPWMNMHGYSFLKGCYIFHPNCGCSLHRSSINIYKCQNNKEGSKILLMF
jgi:hypothetical protein